MSLWKKSLQRFFIIPPKISGGRVLAVPPCSIRTDDEVKSMFEAWVVKQCKSYNTIEEKKKRFKIFRDNLRFIDRNNSITCSVGLNRFADLTCRERSLRYTGVKRILKKTPRERAFLHEMVSCVKLPCDG